MARRLRIQYRGALYHIINRGNYRRDVFESVGAAEAFLKILFEAAEKFGWKLHAYVLMRNHFHLAVETPEPSLAQGMHWLQSTLATRFNRFRQESGHLFQGRYKSLLVQDFAAMARVVDYIHLNPVRAKIVGPEQVKNYRWSSLPTFLKGSRPISLMAADWLAARGEWKDDAEGWKAYEAYLVRVAQDGARWERDGLAGLSVGWAIGAEAWKQSMARQHAQLMLAPGLHREEAQALRESLWQYTLEQELASVGKTTADLQSRPRKQPWKIDLAQRIRDQSGASMTWLAEALQLGKPESLRSYLCRHKNAKKTSTPV